MAKNKNINKNEKKNTKEKEKKSKNGKKKEIALFSLILGAPIALLILVLVVLFSSLTLNFRLSIAGYKHTTDNTGSLAGAHYYKQTEESYIAFNLNRNYFYERKRVIYGEQQDIYHLQIFYKLDETGLITLIASNSKGDEPIACYIGVKSSIKLPGEDEYPDELIGAKECSTSIHRGERMDFFIEEAVKIKDTYEKNKPWYIFGYQVSV